MRNLFLIFVVLLGLSLQAQERCLNSDEATYYKVGWVKMPKLVKRVKLIDMGGVSTHSPTQFLNLDHKFKYHPGETNAPKMRYVHDCVYGKMAFILDSNNDTGEDIIQVEASGETLMLCPVRKGSKPVLKFDFAVPTTIVVTVWNTGSPNHSPGAFQVSIVMIYYKIVWRWERKLLSYTPSK